MGYLLTEPNYFAAEIPSISKTRELFEKNRSLVLLEPANVRNSLKFLTSIGATLEDIREDPTILRLRDVSQRMRYETLLECGLSEVTIFYLRRYEMIMGRNELNLKLNGMISDDIDVQKRLSDILKVELVRCNESASLKTIRMHMLQLFFAEYFNTTTKEFQTAMTRNYAILHKSFRNTQELTDLILNVIKIPKEDVKKTFHILTADSDNVRNIIKMKYIGGMKTEKLLRMNLMVMKASYVSIEKTIGYVKQFGIAESAVPLFPQVLTLEHQTVYQRLSELVEIPEFQKLLDHPHVLRLIYYQPKALARLDYLKLLNMKYFSLRVMTGSFESFLK